MMLNRRRALGPPHPRRCPGMAVAAQGSAEASFQQRRGERRSAQRPDHPVDPRHARAGPAPSPSPVDWEVAETADFKTPTAKGARRRPGPSGDHTVKVDAAGLKPGRAYYYRFRVGDARLAHGPQPDPADRPARPAGAGLRLLLALPGRPFQRLRPHRAELERLDAVVHLGDYIYEYGAAPDELRHGRSARRSAASPSRRTRSSAWPTTASATPSTKRDPDLQAAHARALDLRLGRPRGLQQQLERRGGEPPAEDRRLMADAARPRRCRPITNGCRSASPPPGRAYEAHQPQLRLRRPGQPDHASRPRLTARSQQLIPTAHPGDIPMAVYAARIRPGRPPAR